MKLKIKDILGMSRQAVFNIDKDYTVVYEDGVEVKTRRKSIIFDRYCQELFLLHPNTPITSKCTVTSIIGSGYFNMETHTRLLEFIFKHICEFNNLKDYKQKEPLLKLVYIAVNNIFNELIHGASEYVSTIDALDFINLLKEPSISSIHTNLKPYPDSIERAYKDIKTYVNNNENSNRFVNAYRSKAINENQANQCIGPRGFVTDLDRAVFKQPIVNGFIKGMGSLYEMITESRTAAKSLNANDTHIKTSEYASRRIQLLTMVVDKVDQNDCGSTEYFQMLVTKDNINNLKGKYYLDEETNQLNWIRGNETDILGKVLKLRTALGCRAPNPHSVCTTCLGKIADNFKENSNLGYTMTSSLMEKLTQSILSTKHLTHSVRKSLIQLPDSSKKWFNNDQENNIYFNKDLDLTNCTITFPNSKMAKLIDVLSLQHTNISLNKIGELDTVLIKDAKHKTLIQDIVTVSYGDRMSIITKDFLEYIKTIKVDSDSRGNFVIPLDGYNKELPVFNNPLKETNIIAFVNKVASMIETNKDKASNPYDKLSDIFTAVTEQFSCNLTVVEVIVYATTTKNSFNQDYRLGRSPVFNKSESSSTLFRHRSSSALLTYEDQISELIKHPTVSFGKVNRTNHPVDVLFQPAEVIANSK